jgi:DNA-directed RNA polymerase subunit K/omega
MSLNENLLSSLSEETHRELEKQTETIRFQDRKSDPIQRDLLAEDFRDKIDNIYEAIIVIAQRARQIGQKQSRIIEHFLASKKPQETDDAEEEAPRRKPTDEDDDEPRLPKFEKPTILAMNELLKGEIKYDIKE